MSPSHCPSKVSIALIETIAHRVKGLVFPVLLMAFPLYPNLRSPMEYSGDPSLASLAFVACVPPRHGQGWSDPEMSKGVRPNPPCRLRRDPPSAERSSVANF